MRENDVCVVSLALPPCFLCASSWAFFFFKASILFFLSSTGSIQAFLVLSLAFVIPLFVDCDGCVSCEYGFSFLISAWWVWNRVMQSLLNKLALKWVHIASLMCYSVKPLVCVYFTLYTTFLPFVQPLLNRWRINESKTQSVWLSRVTCQQPYVHSILFITGMSFFIILATPFLLLTYGSTTSRRFRERF